MARFKHGGGSRVWNVVDMVRACFRWHPARCHCHCFVPEVLHALAKLAEARDWRRRRWFGNSSAARVDEFSWRALQCLPSGLASSSDSCRVTLDREREEQFCGLLMFHTHSPSFPRFPEHTFALQGISERRLVAASQCLEALDKRLPGMPGSWRGGGHLEVYHSATAKPSHAGISSCENGEADMVGRILATLAVSFLHFYIMPLPGASSICLVQMMSISSTIRLHWRHGKSWRLAALSPSTSSARDGGAPLWPPFCMVFCGIFGHFWSFLVDLVWFQETLPSDYRSAAVPRQIGKFCAPFVVFVWTNGRDVTASQCRFAL